MQVDSESHPIESADAAIIEKLAELEVKIDTLIEEQAKILRAILGFIEAQCDTSRGARNW